MIVYQGCTEAEWLEAVHEKAGLKEWGVGTTAVRRVDPFGEPEQVWVEESNNEH